MADFLLAMTSAGRQIIVETHSEHLVNRLRTVIAEDPKDEKVTSSNWYSQRKGTMELNIKTSEVNRFGGLNEDWPDGFLDVSGNTANALIQASLQKRQINSFENTEPFEVGKLLERKWLPEREFSNGAYDFTSRTVTEFWRNKLAITLKKILIIFENYEQQYEAVDVINEYALLQNFKIDAPKSYMYNPNGEMMTSGNLGGELRSRLL